MLQRVLLHTSRAARPSARVAATPFAARAAASSPLRTLQAPSHPSFTTAPQRRSVATEATGTADGEAVPPTQAKAGEASDAKSADPLKAELEVKSKEIVELKDKYLRSVADFRNLQDRTKRDVQAAKNFAIQRFAKDLIDSVDNLDRALTTVPAELLQQADAKETNKDLVNLHEGLKMTETILMQTLGKHGLTRFDPSAEGEKFNPNLHEATFMAPVEGKQDGEVVQTQQKGFLLNGRVLRAAKVGVVKNS